jgi:predicted DNA-binding ribbon-helix-helix protein
MPSQSPNHHLIKRSFSLNRHATSVALEAEFWAVLERVGAARGQALAALVREIDASRGVTPLASAIRVWALAQAQSGQTLPLPAGTQD